MTCCVFALTCGGKEKESCAISVITTSVKDSFSVPPFFEKDVEKIETPQRLDHGAKIVVLLVRSNYK